jgi:hypothetical protein
MLPYLASQLEPWVNGMCFALSPFDATGPFAHLLMVASSQQQRKNAAKDSIKLKQFYF